MHWPVRVNKADEQVDCYGNAIYALKEVIVCRNALHISVDNVQNADDSAADKPRKTKVLGRGSLRKAISGKRDPKLAKSFCEPN